MTNAPDTGAASESPPASVTYDFKGSVDYSMIKGLPAFESDDYYEQFFKDYIRVREIRDRMLGGHMVDEAAGAGITAGPPSTAYSNPQGERVNPNPPPGAPPVQQTPLVATQGAQRGVQPGQVVPLEACDRCNGPAKYKEAFRSKAGKAISATLICSNCRDGTYDHNIRWLNSDDPAWVTING